MSDYGDVNEPMAALGNHGADGQQNPSPYAVGLNPGVPASPRPVSYGLIGGIPGRPDTYVEPGTNVNPINGGAGTQHVG